MSAVSYYATKQKSFNYDGDKLEWSEKELNKNFQSIFLLFFPEEYKTRSSVTACKIRAEFHLHLTFKNLASYI